MFVAVRQIVMALRRPPQDGAENVELQGEIQQVMLQAVKAEAGGAFLGVSIDPALARVPTPGPRQALPYLSIWKTYRCGLVQVVQHLTVQPIAVDSDRGKETLIHQRADEARHVILGRFKGQEDRRLRGVGETAGFCSQRPKQVHHAAGEATDSSKRDLPARANFRGMKGFLVGLLQGALGGEDEYGIGRLTRGKEHPQAFHPDRGLAAASRTGEEYPVRGWEREDFALGGGQIHKSRLAESRGFVNHQRMA